MCTMITETVAVEGCGRAQTGWIDLQAANVSFDHPFQAPLEHALNIDFVNPARGPGARVAVELTAETARALAATILAVLERAEAAGHAEAARPGG